MDTGKQNLIVSWVAVGVWAGFIFLMSNQSGSDLHNDSGIISAIFAILEDAQKRLLGDGVDLMSPAAHFLEYAVLGLLLARALRLRASCQCACLLAIVFASLYGITDEVHQWFVPGRMPDPADWIVDSCGAIVGSVAFCAFKKQQI